jgi:hypothetical protein
MGKAERLGRLEVYGHLKFCRKLHWEIARREGKVRQGVRYTVHTREGSAATPTVRLGLAAGYFQMLQHTDYDSWQPTAEP